jgi:hypothetical protein
VNANSPDQQGSNDQTPRPSLAGRPTYFLMGYLETCPQCPKDISKAICDRLQELDAQTRFGLRLFEPHMERSPLFRQALEELGQWEAFEQWMSQARKLVAGGTNRNT